MENRRVFISIEVPPLIKEQISRITSAVKGLQAHPVDNFHVTLKFIGEVTEDQLRLVESLLDFAGQQSKKFPLHFTGLKVVESRLRLVGKKSQAIEDLFDTIVLNLEKIGMLKPDRIAFEPHVTLGRVPANFKVPVLVYDFSRLDFNVEKIVLFETLQGNGSVMYEPLKEVSLN